MTILLDNKVNQVSPASDKKDDELLDVPKPPHNLDIEQALLATLMSLDDSFERIEGIVSADDFYGDRHKHIFIAISHLSLTNQPYDTLMVYDYLIRQNMLDLVGGEAYLMQINQSPTTLFNLEAYAKRIKELAIYRQLITTANTMLSLAYKPKQRSVVDILDIIEADIFRIGESYTQKSDGQGLQRVDDVLGKIVHQLQELQNLDGSMIGLETPFTELNNKTQGLQKGDLVIVAARPSMGKTTFALNLAEAVLISGLPVVIFSMEMPATAIVMRMVSAFGEIAQGNVRSGKMNESEWEKFYTAVGFLQNLHLYIDDRNNLPPSEVRATCRRIAKNHPTGLGMIIVDYLQLMKVAGMENNRVNEIGEISRSLKALAREMNCPVVALSQLNRDLERRTDKRPVMADLRESGAIEQDADLIMFIYRDEVYYKDKKDNHGIAEVIIGKQRNGPIGKVVLNFKGEYTKFSNLEIQIPDYEE